MFIKKVNVVIELHITEQTEHGWEIDALLLWNTGNDNFLEGSHLMATKSGQEVILDVERHFTPQQVIEMLDEEIGLSEKELEQLHEVIEDVHLRYSFE